MDWTSLIGTVASLIGLGCTYHQVLKTQKAAIAAESAANSTKESIQKSISIVQVTKYSEQILTIQQEVNNDEIKLALHLCHELKSALLDLQKHQTILEHKTELDLSNHIVTLGINITNMLKCLTKGTDKLNKTKIASDLEQLHEVMCKIQIQLKENI